MLGGNLQIKEFLYSAIEDTQDTIRSLDLRSGFVFLILCSPAPLADKIGIAAREFFNASLPLVH